MDDLVLMEKYIICVRLSIPLSMHSWSFNTALCVVGELCTQNNVKTPSVTELARIMAAKPKSIYMDSGQPIIQLMYDLLLTVDGGELITPVLDVWKMNEPEKAPLQENGIREDRPILWKWLISLLDNSVAITL